MPLIKDTKWIDKTKFSQDYPFVYPLDIDFEFKEREEKELVHVTRRSTEGRGSTNQSRESRSD